jgi:hypothetical protein
MTLRQRRRFGLSLATGIMAVAIAVGVAMGAPRPILRANPNPIVQSQPFTLTGQNFTGHPTVRLQLSDGQTFTVSVSAKGRFSIKITTNTTDSQLTVDAYDGATAEFIASL